MTAIARIENGLIVETWPKYQPEVYIRPPVDDHMTEDRWAEFGVYRVTVAPSNPPAGQYVSGHALQVVDGLPMKVPQYADKTPEMLAAERATAANIDVEEYADRFTKEEMQAVLAAANAGDAECQYLLLMVQTRSKGINLDSPTVIAGLTYLEAQGHIAAGRADEIRGLLSG